MNCRFCGRSQNLTYKERSAIMKQAFREAKANGKPVGRHKSISRERVWKLRDDGYSIRGLASVLNISTSTVQLILKERA